MLDFFKEKKVVIKYDTPNGNMMAWGEGRFVSHSRLLSDLKEILSEKYGDKFHITNVVKVVGGKIVWEIWMN